MKQQKIPSIFVALFFIGGCAFLLPSKKHEVKSPWKTFNEAKDAFDKITPYETTFTDLKELGFDPFTSPNIKILTYLDIIDRFMPNLSINMEDLNEGIQECISAKNSCQAYEIKLKNIDEDRFGNFFLDFLEFRRKTKRYGWEFKALIVITSDCVIYKLWEGKPRVDEVEVKKKPLGFLQDANEVMIDIILKD